MSTTGVYLHIPFCAKKCGYCDFNAYSGYKDATKARYVAAICAEIAARADHTKIGTIFFGGGTPTQLSSEAVAEILRCVCRHFDVAADAEISVEANPSDTDARYLDQLLAAGVNRLSFGVQTFNDRLLVLIDRLHTASCAITAIQAAQAAGFSNLSLDLMFGLPRQTLADWDRTLETALALDIPHLSIYNLIVEPNTPFFARQERGKLPLPGEDNELLMWERAVEKTKAAGLARYEISNYARPNFACRHNLLYWRNEPYFGFGAGASSYINSVRSVNIKRPSDYIQTVLAKHSVFLESEQLTPKEAMGETVMIGLRMLAGIDLDAFAARFGVRAEQHFADTIATLQSQKLVTLTDTHLRLTETGLLLANDAMAAFL
jgi:oxygen-independent coproporphyrinogen III oxidase